MMKKILCLVILLSVFIFPFKAYAKDYYVAGNKYKVQNFLETLEEEEITPKVSDFKEDDNKINIYLFYGKGCEPCKDFLNLLNDISPEYGQYFNVISFEIYGEANNATLLKSLARSIAVTDDGVPFIFIGDKYFNGYDAETAEEIKNAIKNTYDTDIKVRTDIMKAYEKEIGYKEPTKGLSDGMKIVLLDLIMTSIATVIIIVFISFKFDSLKASMKK